jgi:uncharacterized damage-inducible protein DinB
MKRIAIAVVCLFLLSAFTFAADKPKADAKAATTAAHQDKKFLLNYLQQTRKDFLKSISGLSEAQWNYKASPERWSIAECAEHITLAEDFIREAYAKTMNEPAASEEQKAKANIPDEKLVAMLTDRSQKFKAPEPIQPKTHQWTTPQAIKAEFNKRRAATIQVAKSTSDSDLRGHVADSPVGAPLDAYQFLELIAAHSKRHTLQIEEVKADPGYPKK